jgi:hypothetical protein
MDLMPMNEESFLPPREKGHRKEGDKIPTVVINTQTLTQKIKQ